MPTVQRAALTLQRLLSIHPFADANGRTSRAVLDLILERGGFPPATFRDGNEDTVAVFGRLKRNVTPEEAVLRATEALDSTMQFYRDALA